MRHIIITLGLLCLVGCAASEAPARVQQKGHNDYGPAFRHALRHPHTLRQVIVKSGDTLYSIAAANRVVLPVLASLNHMDHPYIIHVGEKLKLPPHTLYQVKAGDTIRKLGQVQGVDPREILLLNHLDDPQQLYVGRTLILPLVEKPIHIAAPPVATTKWVLQSATTPVMSEVEAIDQVKIIEPKRVDNQSSPPPGKFKNGKMVWPVKGKILSHFGVQGRGVFNDGINISAPLGTEVYAADKGEVIYADNGLKGYGNLVIIRHANGLLTSYAHQDALLVAKGDQVARGEVIGKVGKSGHVNSPQLHFAVRKGKKPINPLKYFG